MLETYKEIFSLMCEMAEEGFERARIKAQQNRIYEVIRIDKRQLESIYARIGRIDVTGSDKDKRDALVEEAKKIEARIVRAQIRYQRLKEAASVDQCTKAFEEKLADTVKNAKEAAGEKARDFKDFAKDKGSDIASKIKDASADFSVKAEDLTIKAKDKAADLGIRAKDKADDLKDKAKIKADDLKGKAKVKANDIKEKTKEKIARTTAKELDADENVLDNVDDILKRIEDTINSVDDESAEEFKF